MAAWVGGRRRVKVGPLERGAGVACTGLRIADEFLLIYNIPESCWMCNRPHYQNIDVALLALERWLDLE